MNKSTGTRGGCLAESITPGNEYGPNSGQEQFYENQVAIRRVLKFWFGSGTPDENQKKLWMIAS